MDIKGVFTILRTMKNYANRSSSYLSIVNTILLVYVAFRSNLNLKFAVIAPLTLIVVVISLYIIGKLDKELGFLRADVEYHDRNNPVMIEIMQKIEKVQNSIDGIVK